MVMTLDSRNQLTMGDVSSWTHRTPATKIRSRYDWCTTYGHQWDTQRGEDENDERDTWCSVYQPTTHPLLAPPATPALSSAAKKGGGRGGRKNRGRGRHQPVVVAKKPATTSGARILPPPSSHVHWCMTHSKTSVVARSIFTLTQNSANDDNKDSTSGAAAAKSSLSEPFKMVKIQENVEDTYLCKYAGSHQI